ncbi:5-oxoproline transporter, DUF969 family subunit [Staphylococcus saprophyticus]|uniref:5-oxoproline transporter, DUF969 family subunit n=1 Tax=Staphylococcus saprophyticus TaxID=29385 RepID=UPI00360E9CCF
MEWLKLIGIIIIILGFLLKIDTIAVILIAAVVTGLCFRFRFICHIRYIRKSVCRNRLVYIIYIDVADGRTY